MLRTLLVSLSAALAAASASARAADDLRWLDVAPVVGAWIPTGDGARAFSAAPLVGVQAVAELDPRFALLATVTWVPTDAKRLASEHLDLFQYDVGFRVQHALSFASGATLRPFLSAGGGLRTIHFRGASDGGTDFGTYAGAGLEVAYRRMTAGVTVRYDITMMEPAELHRTYRVVETFATAGIRF
jgi:hypothetical protein